MKKINELIGLKVLVIGAVLWFTTTFYYIYFLNGSWGDTTPIMANLYPNLVALEFAFFALIIIGTLILIMELIGVHIIVKYKKKRIKLW